MILLENQVKRAFDGTSYNFDEMFEYTAKYISAADFSIGVFEGPCGGSQSLYSQSNFRDGKVLRLNFPDEFADAVKKAGFNLVTTANNHVLDMGVEGSKRTIEVLREKNLDFVGSYLSHEDKAKSRVKIVEKDGIKMAVLAYTYGANRFTTEKLMDENFSYITQVLPAPDSPFYETVLEGIKKDFEIAKSHNPDLIIVLPHWGTQFVDEPNEFQEVWRKNFLSLGADIILGCHTHSVQPIKFETVDGRQTYTLYCPGNYTNIFRKFNGDASILAEVYIDRQSKKIIGGSIIPMWTQSALEGNYRPLPIYDILTNSKLRKSISTFELANRILTVLKHITKVVLGAESGANLIQEHYYIDEVGFQRKINTAPINPDFKRGKFFELLQSATAVCFVGDSVTHGSRNGGVPWYEPYCAFMKGKIFNCARDSLTIKVLLEKYLNIVAAVQADLFVVAIGTNDIRYRKPEICAMTPEEYISDLQILRTEILKNNPAAKFAFIAPWTSTENDKACVLKHRDKKATNLLYTEALRQWCEKNQDIFINANPYIDAVFDKYVQSDYLIDYIHPNATKGVSLYAESVLKDSQEKLFFFMDGFKKVF